VHAPDGFLNASTAIATAGLSAGAVGVALRRTRAQLDDRQVPLAGVAAAFIFSLQMVNFPVAAGTTGHLLGGALAAILLGPAMGALVVTVVVAVQALVFADGGLTALGYNVLNMAVVTSFGGFALYRLLRRVLPRNATGVIAATGLASGLSVVLAATAFSLEWLFGATVPVPFDTVFGAMVGVHLLIGVGEGLLSGMAVGTVLASRPDLVCGARDLERAALAERPAIGMRSFVVAGVLVALLVSAVLSQFAASDPDGLQSVAEQTGFADQERSHALSDGLFAGYATSGIGNQTLSLAVAGMAGVAITLAVGSGLVMGGRNPRGPGRTTGDRAAA
jgi:cobalt/nickel transport system permease protein